jgi:MFS family permease
VSTTRAEPPRATAAERLPYGQLGRATPVAVVGCALSGLISGAFYALVPAWMQDAGTPRATIALFMLVAVLGGLAFQVPVGWLSDRFDRRLVLAALGLGFASSAVILVHLPRSLPVVLPFAAVLGGFISTLYPVCVSHAHDRMPADRVLAVSGRLILLSGLGSVVGPLIGASVMAHFTIDGVFYFMAAAALSLTLLAAGRSFTTMAPHQIERPFEILAPQAATLAHDPLDASDEPRSPDPIKVASEDN